MKKAYKQPTIKVVELHPRTAMLVESYGDGIEVTGIEKRPGYEDDFW